MGRWRDGVILCIDRKLDPDNLEELFIDTNNEVVGGNIEGLFKVTDYEQDKPLMISFSLPDAISNFTKSRHSFNGCNVLYQKFREEVAGRLSLLQLSFNSYIKGNGNMMQSSDSIDVQVAITPIYVKKRDFGYQQVDSKSSTSNYSDCTSTLGELFIDQESEIVGKDKKETYKVVDYEQNKPFLVSFSLPYDEISYLKPGLHNYWHDQEKDKHVHRLDLFNHCEVLYQKFREEVAESLDKMPLRFHSFIRGREDIVATANSMVVQTAITPIYVKEREFDYKPVSGKSLIHNVSHYNSY